MRLTGNIVDKGPYALSPMPEDDQGHHKARIWIIVANEVIARIFRKTDGHLEEIGLASADAFVEKEFNNRCLGHMAGDVNHQMHHKLSGHNDHHSFQFTHDIADWLVDVEAMRLFDRLVLVAAPKTLSDFRRILSSNVQSHIVAEIDKDFTKMNGKELFEALNKILWF